MHAARTFLDWEGYGWHIFACMLGMLVCIHRLH